MSALPFHDARVAAVLERLHAEATRQIPALIGWYLRRKLSSFFGRASAEPLARWAGMERFHVPLDRAQGAFLYLLARSMSARRIVEYGTSVGISTIYLAAAVRDNGGGLVIGSELAPAKVAAARAHLAEAGLAEWVEVREGDARETLRDLGGPVDLGLIDGWPELALEMGRLIGPQLRPGGVLVADNVRTFRRILAPYVAHMQGGAGGFLSATLPLKGGTEFSVRLPAAAS